jgi:hypothetical protein
MLSNYLKQMKNERINFSRLNEEVVSARASHQPNNRMMAINANGMVRANRGSTQRQELASFISRAACYLAITASLVIIINIVNQPSKYKVALELSDQCDLKHGYGKDICNIKNFY